MNDMKSFLGFTDTIKEPRKTKVEDTLNKVMRYNGLETEEEKNPIMSRKQFLLFLLKQGNDIKQEDNVTYYSRKLEGMTKPKTEYKIYTLDGCYYEITKTEYDFCMYCKENNLVTNELINAYITEEEKRLQTIKQQEEENARIQAEKERAKREEIERIHSMIQEEVETLPEEQKEIMDSIYLSLLGMEANNRSYMLLVCINHFDNVICKNEIISRLHNDNIASIKTFECITGLKLPKGYKDRIEYLNSITSRDFIGMIEYKERKKAEQKEVITEEFYISEANGKEMHWKKVIAEPYNEYGLNMFIRIVNGRVLISEVKTGLLITDGKNRTEAKQKLDDFINREGSEKITELLKQKQLFIEEKAGRNPLYQIKQIA